MILNKQCAYHPDRKAETYCLMCLKPVCGRGTHKIIKSNGSITEHYCIKCCRKYMNHLIVNIGMGMDGVELM